MTQKEHPWTVVGKTCLVTGANCGIGFATVHGLAKRGARRVILACRDVTAGELAAAKVGEALGASLATSVQLVVKHVDLASLDSVRALAAAVISEEPRLDVLVNNAAVLQPDNVFETTESGFEKTFATNFLGHCLLTNLLLDLLKKSPSSRIVNVSSQAYQAAWPRGYDLNDINQVRYRRRHRGYFSYWRAYSQSKLAIIMYSQALHQRHHSDGVCIFSLHPGEIRTRITRHRRSPFNFIRVFLALFGTDTEKNGAAVPLHCACEPGLEKHSGKYFGKRCRVERLFDMAKDKAKIEELYAKVDEWLVPGFNYNEV